MIVASIRHKSSAQKDLAKVQIHRMHSGSSLVWFSCQVLIAGTTPCSTPKPQITVTWPKWQSTGPVGRLNINTGGGPCPGFPESHASLAVNWLHGTQCARKVLEMTAFLPRSSCMTDRMLPIWVAAPCFSDTPYDTPVPKWCKGLKHTGNKHTRTHTSDRQNSRETHHSG